MVSFWEAWFPTAQNIQQVLGASSLGLVPLLGVLDDFGKVISSLLVLVSHL